MIKNKAPRSGFTLIELLTVIAIIGILAGILIPTVGAVKTKASMVTSSSNLRQIAMAYNTFSSSGTRTRIISKQEAARYLATTREDWAEILAEFGELNDASLYFISSADDVAAITMPSIILNGTTGAYTPNTDWTEAVSAISYEMAVDLSTNAASSTSPLIWTKGIGTDGLWDTQNSPWLGKGGHIAFADGHVTFYETLVEDGQGVLVVGPKGTNPGTKANTPQAALGGEQYILKATN